MEHLLKLLKWLVFWVCSFSFLLQSPVQPRKTTRRVAGQFQKQKGLSGTLSAVSKLETGYWACARPMPVIAHSPRVHH